MEDASTLFLRGPIWPLEGEFSIFLTWLSGVAQVRFPP